MSLAVACSLVLIPERPVSSYPPRFNPRDIRIFIQSSSRNTLGQRNITLAQVRESHARFPFLVVGGERANSLHQTG